MKGEIIIFQETFKALSDKTRRDILEFIKKDKKTAGEIADRFNLSNSTISYHLSILKKADLIYEVKYKNFIYYQIKTSILEDITAWLINLRGDDNE